MGIKEQWEEDVKIHGEEAWKLYAIFTSSTGLWSLLNALSIGGNADIESILNSTDSEYSVRRKEQTNNQLRTDFSY